MSCPLTEGQLCSPGIRTSQMRSLMSFTSLATTLRVSVRPVCTGEGLNSCKRVLLVLDGLQSTPQRVRRKEKAPVEVWLSSLLFSLLLFLKGSRSIVMKAAMLLVLPLSLRSPNLWLLPVSMDIPESTLRRLLLLLLSRRSANSCGPFRTTMLSWLGISTSTLMKGTLFTY